MWAELYCQRREWQKGFTTSRQLIQLMNEKLIAPYSMITEKEKEIERLNREIGRLEALLEVSKKMNAQQEDVAKCADAV